MNKDVNTVTISDLSKKSFEAETVGQDKKIVAKVDPNPSNRLSLGANGLLVGDPPLRSFILSPTANVRMTDNQETRRILYLTGNVGVLHLDFVLVRTRGNTQLFQVPSDCPLPLHMIEMNANGGFPIWWEPNTRTVYADSRVTKNQRIIFHASGIFTS